jgi:translocation and assembly module TamB
MNSNHPLETATPPPRRRWLRGIVVAIMLLLALIIALSAWLLGTSSGLRFALARVQAATNGALQVRQAQGRLIGPLDLTGVS